MKGYEKYVPYQKIPLAKRNWPNKIVERAPIWCSVDLRDGNQALINPMNIEEKLEFFKLLCDMGFKQIEIGFPSSSEVEYEFCRRLIEEDLIPDDVTIQVLVQAREHLIKKTFDAVKGAKNVILHFYNSTSTLQRKVVFEKDCDGITKIATDAAKLIKSLTDECIGTNITYEYSPESFTGTEPNVSVEICSAVMNALGATKENPVILNLPSTVEMSAPNVFADLIEYFVKHLPDREAAVISLHPHNDRGTGVAAAELGLLAGAQRVEGTLFGNGERTGNLDIVTMGLNMFTQGIDPELDFGGLNKIKSTYERLTKMRVPERQPYAGELVFTAFSGSHQDAINKGCRHMQKSDSPLWEVPYIPIDPADIGRQYEPIIRINSQSGKGGAAFVMNNQFGFDFPKKMHQEFGAIVQKECERTGREISDLEIFNLFDQNYINRACRYTIEGKPYITENDEGRLDIEVVLRNCEKNKDIQLFGSGNGPVDAFFNAIESVFGSGKYEFLSYSQHAIGEGSDSGAVSYSEIKRRTDDRVFFGVGISNNTYHSSIFSVLNAINRAEDTAQSYVGSKAPMRISP
ncbi:MAG: 2-isopropylmalate synthase [Christensenellaceae bacterium]|nr:2-isopropylmalate synthase [Christensenellaceae bacterium]